MDRLEVRASSQVDTRRANMRTKYTSQYASHLNGEL